MMKTMVIFLVVAMVMAGLAFAVVSFFLAPEKSPDPAEQAAQPEDEDRAEEEKTHGEILMIEELLVNPTGTSGTRYLSTSLGLEVADAEVVHRLQKQEMQIRDLLITILSSRTVDELTTAAEREEMRQEIAARLNQLLAPDKVRGVYFVDYVLQ